MAEYSLDEDLICTAEIDIFHVREDEVDQCIIGHADVDSFVVERLAEPAFVEPFGDEVRGRAEDAGEIALAVAFTRPRGEIEPKGTVFHATDATVHEARHAADGHTAEQQQHVFVVFGGPEAAARHGETDFLRMLLERCARDAGLPDHLIDLGRKRRPRQGPGSAHPRFEGWREEVQKSSRMLNWPSHSRTFCLPLIARRRRAIWMIWPISGALATSRSSSDSIMK